MNVRQEGQIYPLNRQRAAGTPWLGQLGSSENMRIELRSGRLFGTTYVAVTAAGPILVPTTLSNAPPFRTYPQPVTLNMYIVNLLIKLLLLCCISKSTHLRPTHRSHSALMFQERHYKTISTAPIWTGSTSAPRALSNQQETILIEKINAYADRGTLLTPRHVQELAEGLCAHVLGVNWATRFIKRHSDQLTSRFHSYQELARQKPNTLENRTAFYNLASILLYTFRRS